MPKATLSLIPILAWLCAGCTPSRQPQPVHAPTAQPNVHSSSIIHLIPQVAETVQKLPSGWSQHVADRSIPTNPQTPIPELEVSTAPHRQINFHAVSPAVFFMEFTKQVKPGDYRLEGTISLDGNQPGATLRTSGAPHNEEFHGGGNFSRVVHVAEGQPFRLDLRLSGEGSYWGALKDVRLAPVAN